MSKPEEIWWRKVPVADRFIEQCISEAKEFTPSYVYGKSLPWADQFLKITKKVIRDKSQDFKVYTVNGAEYDPSKYYRFLDLMVEQIGEFSDYDSTIESIGVELNSRMIFFLVKAVSEDQLQQLKNIAWEAKEHDIYLRLIVQTDVLCDAVPEIKSFKYYNNDINFFVLNLLLEKNSIDLLNYKATLATLLADHNAEKAARCCAEIDNCIYSPQQVCTWLIPEKVDARVRKAKIRFLMPELEMARINFGKRVKDRFGTGTLPHPDMVNGERIWLSLEELEFRHFKYIAKDSRKLALSPDERDMLQVLYDTRNALAHIGKNDEFLTIDCIREALKACDELEK